MNSGINIENGMGNTGPGGQERVRLMKRDHDRDRV